jgi:hypothetical protein
MLNLPFPSLLKKDTLPLFVTAKILVNYLQNALQRFKDHFPEKLAGINPLFVTEKSTCRKNF